LVEQEHAEKSALFALYAVSFLTSVGFGAFGLIVPLYMWGLGVSFSGLGLVFSVFGVAMGIAGIFFGAHSDIVGRKPYLILSLFLNSIVMLLYTQARTLIHFAALQALGGVYMALNNIVVPALITDLTRDAERGRKFGRLGGFGWMGVGLGYFAGGVFSEAVGFHWTFVSVSILGFTSCILVQLFIPSYSLSAGEAFNFSLLRGMPSRLKTWLIITFVTMLTIPPVEAMVIPLYVVGKLGVEKTVFGIFMAASYIMTSFTQFLGGNVADRYSRRNVASFFLLLSGAFIAFQPTVPFFTFFAFLYVLEGVGEGISMPSRNALTSSSARADHRGLDFSILNLAGTLGSTAGFIGTGLILDAAGFLYPFLIRAITYLVAAALIYLRSE